MALTWPIALPQAPASYQEQKQSVTVRTHPDSGPPKSRRKFTKALTKGQMGFMLTNEQAVTLNTFWKKSMQGGALPVNFVHPWNGKTISMMIVEAPSYSQADSPLCVNVTINLEYL